MIYDKKTIYGGVKIFLRGNGITDEGTPEDMFGGNTHIFTMNSTKFKLGCLLSVIIFIFIIYLLFHVFSAMMVVLGPVIIIGVIVALIMKITGR